MCLPQMHLKLPIVRKPLVAHITIIPLRRLMRLFVNRSLVIRQETLLATATFVRLLVRMVPHMHVQIPSIVKPLLANIADVPLLVLVYFLVDNPSVVRREALLAKAALVQPLLRVRSQMSLQIRFVIEALVAKIASVRRFLRVYPFVNQPMLLRREGFLAEAALVRSVGQMRP